MQTALPAKLRTYCRGFLTSVSVCAVNHTPRSYLLGVTLIIHVASCLPVTGFNSRAHCFPPLQRMCQSLLALRVLTFACGASGILLLFPDECICLTDRLPLCLCVHARVSPACSALSRYSVCVWFVYGCAYQIVQAAACAVSFFWRTVSMFRCVCVCVCV